MKQFSFRRLTAWLLTLMMIISVLPASVIVAMAEDLASATSSTSEPIYVLDGGFNTADCPTLNISYNGNDLGTVNVCVQPRKTESIEWPSEGYVDRYSTGSAAITDKDGNPVMIKVKYEGEDAIAEVPLTLNMLNHSGTKTAGDQSGLYITYGSSTSGGGFTLHVSEVYVNNYPEYPDEGAIKVSKTATGIDFQASGVAQVELAVSGVASKKGADLIIMLDTSSSMATWCVRCHKQGCSCGSRYKRVSVLETSLANLIAKLKTPGTDGEVLDIDVAIADFNGFFGERHTVSGTPYDRDANDRTADADYNANSNSSIFTGSGELSADAFVKATELPESYSFTCHSGTNYDYAMDAIYQMAYAKQQRNLLKGDERDLYVIFMSDGATMQWNYYHSQGRSESWEKWIVGGAPTFTDGQPLPGSITTTMDKSYWKSLMNCTEHLYYFNTADTDGDGYVNEHRMANAVKGDPEQYYNVIRKSTEGLVDVLRDAQGSEQGLKNMYSLPGLGAKMFAISFDTQDDGNTNLEYQDKSIASIATHDANDSTQYFYKVTSAAELDHAFDAIGEEIAYAASNAHFEDRMGDSFNLLLGTHEYKSTGSTLIDKSVASVIEVLEYDIYTRQEWIAEGSPEDKLHSIGTRQDTGTVTEAIVFNYAGTRAYSTKIDADGDGIYGATLQADGTYAITDEDDYILIEVDRNASGEDVSLDTTTDKTVVYKKGVIYAASFLYNTNTSPVTTLIKGTSLTRTLPAESFHWSVGTVKTNEQAIRYYVYLDGSLEGQKAPGSYATNNYATLYYDNYLGNPCKIETTSPTMAWAGANVSYAFYLVNSAGEVIVNKATGQTGSFANKIAVTSPVVYEEIFLNNIDQVASIEVRSLGVLPTGYELYDAASVYKITINSNSTGSWEITSGDGKAASTYVTRYLLGNANAFTNATTPPNSANDYTHTVVWFAVLWTPQALPDTVIIDYGLPVEVNVLTNDMFGTNGQLVAVGEYNKAFEDIVGGSTLGYIGDEQFWTESNHVASYGQSYTGKYGKVTLSANGTLVYQLSDVSMPDSEQFTYAVRFEGNDASGNPFANRGYYYDTLTIIPATTIYFEETFVRFVDSAASGEDGIGKWFDLGTYGTAGNSNPSQGEDRPGEYNTASIDRNYIYGFDGIYSVSTSYSLGNAKKVTVNAATGGANCPYAVFEFTGTGFDIISLTDNTTGLILVQVFDKDGVTVRSLMVDNYYGYDYNEETGEWTETDKGAIYQVPVIKVTDLEWGTYTVRIKAGYSSAFDHTGAGEYGFVLDSIRIYDPVDPNNTSDSINNAYKDDGEYNPTYVSIRDKILEGLTVTDPNTTDVLDGVVFVDGIASTGNPYDYANPGPNNEVYLAGGQSISFKLVTNFNPDKAMIGVKLAYGTSAVLNVNCNDGNGISINTSTNIATATDMYYELTNLASLWTYNEEAKEWSTPVITVSNGAAAGNCENILSLTGIKVTEKADKVVSDVSCASDDVSIFPEVCGEAAVLCSFRRWIRTRCL
ncbi:MAG: hypothetical protein ACI3XI_03210 [Eubacteriales bacterium]